MGLIRLSVLLVLFFTALSARAAAPNYEAYYGDINGDGEADVLLRPRRQFVLVHSSIVIPISAQSDGQGFVAYGPLSTSYNFIPIDTSTIDVAGLQPIEAIWRDINGDGKLDLLLDMRAYSMGVFIAYGLQNGLSASITKLNMDSNYGSVSTEDRLSLGDINGDGRLDVVIYWAGTNDGIVFKNLSNTSFSEAQLINDPPGGDPDDGDGASPGTIVAGASEAQFSVSNGEVQYTIPIQVSPGGAGVTPKVSVGYSSSASYGHAGMGFSISGMSAVQRCGHSFERDGNAVGVKGTTTDFACLDGSRLALTSGSYWQNGSQYATEAESYTRVKYYTSASGGYFEAENKNGDIYRYGGTAPTRLQGGVNNGVIARWALDSVRDRLGYGYTLDYVAGTGARFVDAIHYTANILDNSDGYAEIKFYYGTDNYEKTYPLFGKKYASARRLSQISSRVDGETLRNYFFYYTVNGVTGRSLMTEFYECAGDGTCLMPSKIDWQKGAAPDFSKASYTSFPNTPISPDMFEEGYPRQAYNRWVDIDRDGRADYCRITPTGATQSAAEVRCYYNTGGNQFAQSVKINVDLKWILPEDTGPTGQYPASMNWNNDPYWQDINDDGFVDFCFSRPQGNKNSSGTDRLTCRLGSANQNRFSTEVTANIPRPQRLTYIGQRQWVDVNGDGRDDYCMSYITGADIANSYVQCQIRDPDQFSFSATTLTKKTGAAGGTWADVTGDGLPDYCWEKENTFNCYINENGTQLSADKWTKSGSHFKSSESEDYLYRGQTTKYFASQFMDFTGNGYADYCRIYEMTKNGQQGYRASCLESLGDGWGSDIDSTFLPLQSGQFGEVLGEWTQFVDVNDDGKIDWCVEKDAELICYLTTEDGFGEAPVSYPMKNIPVSETGVRGPREYNRAWVDVNGNGVKSYCALFWKRVSPTRERGIACYHSDNEVIPDYVLGVENGFGLSYDVEYKSITDPSVYDYDIEPGPENQIYANSGMQVVSKLTTSNGIGGTNSQEYFYRNYGYIPGELGGLGFEYIKITSELGNRVDETWFSQDALSHQSGMAEETHTSYKVGGALRLVSEQSNTWATKVLAGSTFQTQSRDNIYDRGAGQLRYAVQLESSESKNYELDGALISHTVTNSEYNPYGDLTEQEITASGDNQSFTKVLVNQYENHLSDWVLGRLTRASTTRSGHYGAQSFATATKTSAWEYYGSSSSGLNGMLKKEIVEPDHAELKKETQYTYNSFGLKDTITTIASGSTPRVVTYSYDARGRFLQSQTNTLGHTETYGYDNLTGNRTSSTDVNGLVSAWEYDEIGRQTREVTPSGQAVETRILSCVASCPAYATYYTETKSVSASGAVMAPPVREYKDVLGRTIRTSTTGFDGREILVDQQYDANGELKRRSEPYFAGEQVFWNTITSRDVMGRVVEEINAAGVTTSTSYAGLTQAQTQSWFDILDGHSENRNSVATSDVRGSLRLAVDSDNRAIEYQYDANKNLTSVHLPDGTVIQNGYDLLGRKTSLDDPNTGLWRYAYDGYDQLLVQEDGNGVRTCNRYDTLGRTVARTDGYAPGATWSQARSAAQTNCQGGSPTTTWSYDQPSKGLGRLATTNHQGAYAQELFYDAFGRVTASQVTYGGVTYTGTSLYDQDTGRLKQAGLPTYQGGPSLALEYRYTATGFLYEVGAPNTTDYYWKLGTQSVRGQALRTFLNNGLIEKAAAYDAASGNLTQLRAKMFASSDWNIQNETYQVDGAGSLRQRAEDLAAGQVQETFEYDGVGRLIESRIGNLNNSALSYSQTAQYDVAGNIVSRNDVGSYTYAQTCESAGQTYQPGPYAVTSVAGGQNASYCYDPVGNMISGAGRQISYTSFNKPSSISDASNGAQLDFWYGPGRELIKHVTQANNKTTTKITIGAYEKVTVNQGGNVTTKERYQLPNGVVIAFDDQDYQNPHDAYLFTDSLGSIVAVTSGLGNVTERYRYDPWGRPREELGWLTMDQADWATLARNEGATGKGFTGHEMLDEVGIIHMGGRIYDPALGRFMGADPVIKGVDNVESYNRYSYVLNNPMSYTDPSGYSWLSNTFKKLKRSITKHFREILAIATPALAIGEAAIRYGGRELARFAARNKFAGEIIGLVGVAGCAFATAGAGTASCVTAYQGATAASMAYGSGEPVGKALMAGARSYALAYANVKVAGAIGDQGFGPISSGVAHGFRGAFFAGIAGGDIRSGFTGGFTEGALGRFIGSQGWQMDQGSGTVVAGFISGTVSEVTGGKFAVGALSGAMGYLFNEMARHAQAAKMVDSTGEALSHYRKGDGESVELGPNTKSALRNNVLVQRQSEALRNGTAKHLNDNLSVDLTSEVYHVGRTRVDFSTACQASSCTTTYTGFSGDGFWDPIAPKGFGDGIGGEWEIPGGTGYHYKPYRWSETYRDKF